MRKTFILSLVCMLVVFFNLSLPVGAEALGIKGQRFVKGTEEIYLLVDFYGTRGDACNAGFVGRSYKKKFTVNKEGKIQVSEDYITDVRNQLKGCKQSGRIAVIQLFTALKFRDKGIPQLQETVWWSKEYPKKDPKSYTLEEKTKIVQESWAKFTGDEGKAAQLDLIKKVIDAAKVAEVDFTLSLMWESQTAVGRPGFIDWFQAMKGGIKKAGYDIPLGIHCTNDDSKHRDKIQALIGEADFIVNEGDFATHIGVLKNEGEKYKPVFDKPSIILARNPNTFKSNNECATYKDMSYPETAKQLIEQMFIEYTVLGSTGYPYDRWVDADTMQSEISGCKKFKDEAKEKMSSWLFDQLKDTLDKFCKGLTTSKTPSEMAKWKDAALKALKKKQ